MARPLRLQDANLSYHIYAHGVAGMPIYVDDADRERFLRQLTEVAERYSVECHGYCLMDGHYHLVVTTSQPNLSRAVKHLNGPYGQWWNHRHRRRGHVFEARFNDRILYDDTYFLNACRYMALNPVVAHMVAAPEGWRWSSYRATVGLDPVPEFLHPEKIWGLLGAEEAEEGARLFRQFVEECDATQVTLLDDRVLSADEFVRHFAVRLAAASREVPRRQRRPSLDVLFARTPTRAARAAQILAAYKWGYTTVDLGRYLGVHHSTISKILNKRR